MAQLRVTVGSKIGLHARPAAILAKAAAGKAVEVRIGRTADDAVNAASVLAVMGLGIKAGESVVIIVGDDGDDDHGVLRELADLVASDLDAA